MGAKMALFVGPALLVLHRDDRPGLLWPGYWDLPGGGREAGETPIQTALRETHEEFALTVPPAQVRWGRAYTNSVGGSVWFFVGWMPDAARHDVCLGEEGQGWALMQVSKFLTHPKAVPQFKTRLTDYLNGVAPEPDDARFGR